MKSDVSWNILLPKQKTLPKLLQGALLCAAASLAPAAEADFSGFGTLGYAKSDQSFDYQRHIGQSGTFMRDSILGAQMDVRFNPEWNATVQARLAPALDIDNHFEPAISWAFLSYRPDNDWLIRVGKLRMPFYLYSENMDVGTTYAAARLPIELYAVTPTLDFQGASFVKSWTVSDSELDLDGYWGQSDVPWRTYNRDTAAPFYLPLKIKARGLLLTMHQDENVFRAGYHTADITRKDGQPFYANLAPTVTPGISGTYYMPPAASEQFLQMTTPVLSLGADVVLGNGFRTIGEYFRRTVRNSEIGPDTESYYLSLLKEVRHWTPYVTYARIQSKNLANYQAVNNARVTSAGAPQTVIDTINALQRTIADGMSMYDQYSWAIGTAYTIDNKSKIKAEWLIVHTGAVSILVDAPPGEESGDRRINVFSLSYNFVF